MSSIQLSLPGAAEPISEVIPLVNQAIEILRLRTCNSDEFKQMHAILSVLIEEFSVVLPVPSEEANSAISPNDAFWCRGEVAPPGTEFRDSNKGESVNIEGKKFSYMRWAVNAELESYAHCPDVQTLQPVTPVTPVTPVVTTQAGQALAEEHPSDEAASAPYSDPASDPANAPASGPAGEPPSELDDSYEPSEDCSNEMINEKIMLESLAPILEGLEEIARAHVCSEVEGPDGSRPTLDPNRVVQYMKDLLSSGIEAICPGSGDTKDQEYLSFVQEYRADGHHLKTLAKRVAESNGDIKTFREVVSEISGREDDFFKTHWWIILIVVLVCMVSGYLLGRHAKKRS